MSGPQKGIYDEVRLFLTTQDQNLSYSGEHAGEALRHALADPHCYKGNKIQELKADFYALKERIEQTVLAERNTVIAAIDDVLTKVVQTSEFKALSENDQRMIEQSLNAQKDGLGSQNLIPTLRNRAIEVRTNLLAETLTRITSMMPLPKPAPVPQPDNNGIGHDVISGQPTQPLPAPVHPKFVNLQSLSVNYSKSYIEDAADVTNYVEEIQKALMAEIAAGKKVTV
ncbi:hypothetical protein Brsp04_04654 [Brucella sp. NBRC 12952]